MRMLSCLPLPLPLHMHGHTANTQWTQKEPYLVELRHKAPEQGGQRQIVLRVAVPTDGLCFGFTPCVLSS